MMTQTIRNYMCNKVYREYFFGNYKQHHSMISSLSTFETLPNEFIMMILRYSGNAYSVCRAFCDLNQCLNNILVDRQLHLFTDF